MKPDLSVIIPYHNEGLQFITDTINSVKNTIDVSYEIIVVDDCSKQALGSISGNWQDMDMENVTILRHDENLGVGQAFDTGVAQAKSDNLFLMGSDVRFIPNQWASKMIKEINDHPKAFTCSTCVGMNMESEQGMDLNMRIKRSRRNGATILIFHHHITHPKKPSNFRNILECQWLPVYKGEDKSSFEVPSILGAAYGVKKEWYDYCDGWKLHRSWGTLEPMISLKSWLFGGSCRTAPDIYSGHIFKRAGTHGTPNHHLIYNKLLVATLLFNDYDAKRLIDFLGSTPQVEQGKRMFKENRKAIMKKRKEYEKKITYDIRDYVKRFSIDFRDNS